eukprot:TRINITY_DN13518_c0_g1_i1.p1 TRINITY_DN13518_c0_g1~~TRINITY_DN13518_c0_g1_i1.p1  ORF type:complete len:330 (-),score=58.27 TRINITY_DN13518_c0_g1_i1:147-1136(-)
MARPSSIEQMKQTIPEEDMRLLYPIPPSYSTVPSTTTTTTTTTTTHTTPSVFTNIPSSHNNATNININNNNLNHSGNNHQNTNLPNINNSSVVQTRRNMFSSITESITGSSFIFFIKLSLDGVRLAVILVLLSLSWNDPCDRPLRFILFLQGVLYLISFVAVLLNIKSATLNFCHLISFILMNYYFYTSETCNETNPTLYYLTLSILIIEYILNGAPCFCLCLLCLSLPCLLTLLRAAGIQQSGASEEAIKEIPSMKYYSGLVSEGNNNCSICLLDYQTDELVRQLPCDHYFHQKCIDEWLALNNSCPLCRQPPIKIEGDTQPNGAERV